MKKYKRMKIHLKRLICLLLCIATVFSLASCGFLNGLFNWLFGEQEGYDDVRVELWVETLDEMLYIIERTRSYGTKISQLPTFDCEEYGIDVKFMVTISRDLYEGLEEGELYYERYLKDFYLRSYVFFEDVTVEELERYIDVAYHFKCAYTVEEREKRFLAESPNEAEEIFVRGFMDAQNSYKSYQFEYNGKAQFSINLKYLDFISEENLEILKQTICIIE